MEGNVIFKVLEEIGEKRGAERRQEEIAIKMLLKGSKLSDIIEFTGVDIDRLEELRNSLCAEAMPQFPMT